MRILQEGLSFDDVLLVPQMGILEKRRDADISTDLDMTKLALPIVSAPMQSVTRALMADAMWRAGGFGIIHRFMTVEEQVQQAGLLQNAYSYGVAVGINEGYDRWIRLYAAGSRVFCLDIAHAHHAAVAGFFDGIPNGLKDDVTIIAGNVATRQGALFLAELGVNVIKVGIGPGAACTTREVTGFGVPQLSAIIDCAYVRDEFYPDLHIMADGGIKNSGDIVKALAAGADSVMLGRLLAGADESPNPGLYWGMASHKVNTHHAPEGVEGAVPKTGPVENTLKNLKWGIKSGLSYGGATNLRELRTNAEFMRVTPLSMVETGTRV